MKYGTNHFRFTEEELQLIRSKFPYRKISFEEISKIELKNGIRIKNKVRTLIFGFFILATPSIIIFRIDELKIPDFHQMDDPRRIAVVGIIYLMCLLIGFMSIYVSMAKGPIMKTIYRNGSFDIFSVKKLKERGELEDFISFLKAKVSGSLVEVDDEIIK